MRTMQKLLSVLMVLFLVVGMLPVTAVTPPASQTESDNLLLGGDFESQTETQLKFYHNSGYGSSHLTYYTDRGINGSGCVGLDVADPGKNTCMMVHGGAPIEKGKTYMMSCDVYIPAGTAEWITMDFEQDPMSTWYSPHVFPRVNVTDSWQHIAAIFTVPEDYGFLQLRIFGPSLSNADTNKEILIDNVMLIDMALYGENLMQGGSFESQTETQLKYYHNYESGHLSYYADRGINDSGCVGLDVANPGKNTCMMVHGGAPIEKGKTYMMSCDVYVPAGTAEWITMDFEQDPMSTWYSPNVFPRVYATDSWQHLVAIFTVPEDYNFSQLRIFGPSLANADTNKEILIDNVSLRCRNEEKGIQIDSLIVNDENTMTVVLAESIDGLSTVDVPVRVEDSVGAVIAVSTVTLGVQEDGKTFVGKLVPTSEMEYRSFSALWQKAVELNGKLVLSWEEDREITWNDFGFNPSPFSIIEAKQVSAHTLTVKFSEDIDLIDSDWYPYVALRLIDPASGGVVWSGGRPMQWGASSLAFAEGSKDTLLVTFPDTVDIGVLVSKVNMAEQFISYDVLLSIEEGPASADFLSGNHLIHQIRRANDAKQLSSTYKVGNAAHYDAVLTPVTLIDATADFTLDKVEIISQTQIVLTFSEAVELRNPEAYIRLVNNSLEVKVTEDGNMMWSGHISYYNETHTQVVFTLFDAGINHPTVPVDGLNDLFSRGYEVDGYELRLVVSDNGANPVFNGLVDSIVSTTGKILLADPLNHDIDSLWLELDASQVPTDVLTMDRVEIISDIEGIITFSAPVDIVDTPWLAVRFFDGNNRLMWRTPDGEYTTTGGGSNTAMQWGCEWEWYNKEHTQIKIRISGGVDGMANFNDLSQVDWETLVSGGHIALGFEENNAILIEDNGRVDNIRLVTNSGVALKAEAIGSNRDSVWLPLDFKFTPKTVTASAAILNETQIRVSFSCPVSIKTSPFIALRYLNDGGTLLWAGDNYNRTAMQFYGDWEWENDSHTSLIWTIRGNGTYAVGTISDVLNYAGPLADFKGATVSLCIEELPATGGTVGGFNGAVENVTTLDGTNHLRATHLAGYDGCYISLNVSALKGEKLTLNSAKAIDDTTIELVFSEPVEFGENFTMGVRYLTPTGDSEVLVDGRAAYFKGDWKYKDENKNVIIWTLNSPHADSLSDIFQYNGNFKWNQGARVAFVIMDESTHQASPLSMRINGVTDLSGYRQLMANYATKDYSMTQMDIEIAYELPEKEVQSQEPDVVTEYVTNYMPFTIGSIALVAVGVVGLVALVGKKKGR